MIATGAITASEAVEAAIERAEDVNPTLNAIASETFDRAREQLLQPLTGRFAGLPTFIKDTDDAFGVRTTFGSRAMPDRPAKKSSEFVQQLSSLGLVSLGKTTMPEFGLTGTTESLAFGPTRNPWHPEYSPGGSSGGAAALVAAGVVPFAHANDGGGSIRIPAACCGLFGFKPSRGRFADVRYARLMPINIVAQGILSRSVRDTAAFLAATERDHLNPALSKLGLVERPGKARLRIGMFTNTTFGARSAPDCALTVEETGKLCEELGHRVEELRPLPFRGQDLDDFFLCWATLAFGVARLGRTLFGSGFERSRLEPWTLGLDVFFRKNAWRVPRAARRLAGLGRRYAKLFDRYDLILTPTVAHPAPRLGYLGPQVSFETTRDRLRQWASFTPIHNVVGAPAMSVPMGLSHQGLPIGVQFAAGVGEERRLLELAFALEEARPWRKHQALEITDAA